MEESITSPDDIVETLLFALELRNSESAAHGRRVAELCILIGRAMELGQHDLTVLKRGALLHDIGRIGIPDRILNKNEALSDDEWEIIRRHPENGARLVKRVPLMTEVIPIIAFHHERYDGMGYPAKLKGDKIPVLARICAVAEVYDSLLNEQVYRKAWPRGKALMMIEQESMKSFGQFVITLSEFFA